MKTVKIKFLITMTVFALSLPDTKAQTFKAPASTETDYPVLSASPSPSSYYMNNQVSQVSNTSFYTNRPHLSGYHILVAGYSRNVATGGNGGFTCGFTIGFSPTSYSPSNIIQINDAVDVQVEYLEDPTGGPGSAGIGLGTGYVVAAYYNAVTSRYMCNFYQWVGASTITLVGAPINLHAGTMSYDRISIDASKDGTKVAFAWSDGTVAYTAVAALDMATPALDFSPSLGSPEIPFNTTYACSLPDVAFNRDAVTGDEVLHYVFLDDNGGSRQLSEFKETFNTLYTTSTPSYTPTSVDNESIAAPGVAASLDCPDESNSEIWGYVYTDDNSHIKFRYFDNTVMTPTTITVNDASLPGGNPADITTAPYVNIKPVVAFDVAVSRWHIGWLTSFPPSICCYFPYTPVYIFLDNTWSLLSFNDYLAIPTPATPSFPYDFPPLLSFATHNTSLAYLYTVYCGDPGGPGTDYAFFHKLRDCSVMSGYRLGTEDDNLQAGPNPFSKSIHINVPMSLLKQEIALTVTDMQGRSMGSYKGPATEINTYLDKVTVKLIPGTYMLTAIPTSGDRKVFKIQKTEE